MFNFTKPFYPLLLSAVKGDPENAHKQMLATLSNIENSRHTAWGSLAIKQLQQSFLPSRLPFGTNDLGTRFS